MSLGKDGRLVGAEIDSSELKNDPMLLLLSAAEEQSDYFELDDTMFSLEQNNYMELEDNVFSSFPNNSSSSSSGSLEQDLPFMGFNFSLCLIPEVILTTFQEYMYTREDISDDHILRNLKWVPYPYMNLTILGTIWT